MDMFFCGFASFAGYQSMKSVVMSFVFLNLFIFTGIAQGESIISPPEDVTESVGATATFHCEIDFDENAIMVWEHNHKAIYSYYIGGEEYKIMGTKYLVEHDERKFNLTVNDLEFSDGGTYTCRTIRCSDTATLIVLGKLVLSLIAATSSNKAEICSCLADFGGPRKHKIPDNQFPRLHMYLNSTLLQGTVKEQGLENGREYHRLQQDITLEPSMEGKTITCEIRTSSPDMSLEEKIPIKRVHRPGPVATNQPVNDKDREDDERNPEEGDGRETEPSDNGGSVPVWLLALVATSVVIAAISIILAIGCGIQSGNVQRLKKCQFFKEEQPLNDGHSPGTPDLRRQLLVNSDIRQRS